MAYVFSVSRSSLAMLDRFPRAFSNCVKGGEREKREKEGEKKRKRERERESIKITSIHIHEHVHKK